MKKAQKENATLKRKRAILKILYEHHIVAIREHIRGFLVRSRRRRISMFGAFSYSVKCSKFLPTLVNNRPN
jgi:hypothetical protein